MKGDKRNIKKFLQTSKNALKLYKKALACSSCGTVPSVRNSSKVVMCKDCAYFTCENCWTKSPGRCSECNRLLTEPSGLPVNSDCINKRGNYDYYEAHNNLLRNCRKLRKFVKYLEKGKESDFFFIRDLPSGGSSKDEQNFFRGNLGVSQKFSQSIIPTQDAKASTKTYKKYENEDFRESVINNTFEIEGDSCSSRKKETNSSNILPETLDFENLLRSQSRNDDVSKAIQSALPLSKLDDSHDYASQERCKIKLQSPGGGKNMEEQPSLDKVSGELGASENNFNNHTATVETKHSITNQHPNGEDSSGHLVETQGQSIRSNQLPDTGDFNALLSSQHPSKFQVPNLYTANNEEKSCRKSQSQINSIQPDILPETADFDNLLRSQACIEQNRKDGINLPMSVPIKDKACNGTMGSRCEGMDTLQSTHKTDTQGGSILDKEVQADRLETPLDTVSGTTCSFSNHATIIETKQSITNQHPCSREDSSGRLVETQGQSIRLNQLPDTGDFNALLSSQHPSQFQALNSCTANIEEKPYRRRQSQTNSIQLHHILPETADFENILDSQDVVQNSQAAMSEPSSTPSCAKREALVPILTKLSKDNLSVPQGVGGILLHKGEYSTEQRGCSLQSTAMPDTCDFSALLKSQQSSQELHHKVKYMEKRNAPPSQLENKFRCEGGLGVDFLQGRQKEEKKDTCIVEASSHLYTDQGKNEHHSVCEDKDNEELSQPLLSQVENPNLYSEGVRETAPFAAKDEVAIRIPSPGLYSPRGPNKYDEKRYRRVTISPTANDENRFTPVEESASKDREQLESSKFKRSTRSGPEVYIVNAQSLGRGLRQKTSGSLLATRTATEKRKGDQAYPSSKVNIANTSFVRQQKAHMDVRGRNGIRTSNCNTPEKRKEDIDAISSPDEDFGNWNKFPRCDKANFLQSRKAKSQRYKQKTLHDLMVRPS